MNRTLDLAITRSRTAACVDIVATAQFDDVAVVVLDYLVAADDICAAEPDFAPRLQAEELARRFFHEIVLLYPDLPGERNLAHAEFGPVRMIHCLHHLDLVFGIVRDHHLERFQDRHAPLGFFTEHLAYAVFEHAHFNELVFLRNAAALHEITQRSRGITTPSHAGNSRHARVIPAADNAVLDHHPELALARDRVGEVQARELDLARPVRWLQLVQEPVVQRPVILELQRAQRVRDVLEGVGQRVREVVHRVDAPAITGALMIDVPDAIQRRVAQVHVRRRHVDLRPQHVLAVGEFARAHAPEQVQVLLGATIAVRAVCAGLR